MEVRKNNDITTGVIWKQILIFFFPILVGAFFQTLYNTVDASIVGKSAGSEALASVGGSSGQILNFVFTFFMGLATGATVIIAQYFGAKEYDRVDDSLHTAYTFAVVGGLALGVIGFFGVKPFLVLLRTPDNLMANSILYVRTLFVGLVFTLIYNIGSGILRAIGDSKRPLYILMSCCGLNIALDVFFVVILKMGVFGAGLATDISQAFSAFLITFLLMKKTPGMELSLRKLHINPVTLGMILKIGLPTAIAGSMFSVSNMIVQTSLNQMGVSVVAAWTAYGRIDALWWMINQAFSVSITTFVGQNYGAGLPERIKKANIQVIMMEVGIGIVLSIGFITMAPILLRLFADNKEVIEIGVSISKILAPFYSVFAIAEILSATLRAENYVMVSTVTTLLGICAYRVVWVKFIVPGESLQKILSCYPISWTIVSVLVLIYFLFKQPKVIKEIK